HIRQHLVPFRRLDANTHGCEVRADMTVPSAHGGKDPPRADSGSPGIERLPGWHHVHTPHTDPVPPRRFVPRSEEHTSELQSPLFPSTTRCRSHIFASSSSPFDASMLTRTAARTVQTRRSRPLRAARIRPGRIRVHRALSGCQGGTMFTHHIPTPSHLAASSRSSETPEATATTAIPESQRMLYAYRSVVFNGELQDENGMEIISRLVLLSAEDPSSDIHLWINSPGG